ncbi:hypothetical protein P3L10_033270 [Capsicum annuum]
MVEGAIRKAYKTKFTKCWNAVWRTSYIIKLALSAGIGGFLFSYDTGVISGLLLVQSLMLLLVVGLMTRLEGNFRFS